MLTITTNRHKNSFYPVPPSQCDVCIDKNVACSLPTNPGYLTGGGTQASLFSRAVLQNLTNNFKHYPTNNFKILSIDQQPHKDLLADILQ